MAGILVNEMKKIKITEKEKEVGDLHCAFCLDPIPADKVQKCGKCLRRAYCSRECQVIDWKINGRGQGHKNWCKIDYGEEDLDWKVVPIPGKGLGVVALRPLPANYRIMVEACQLNSTSHPRIADLMPEGDDPGSLEKKFNLNCMGCGPTDDVATVLCLRMSRLNHNCDPNADHYYDNQYKVKILIAERGIAAGEEICISYSSFKSVTGKKIPFTAEISRAIFKTKWGFVCPQNCICRDKKLEAVLQRARDLDRKIGQLGAFTKVDEALRAVKTLLELYSEHKLSFVEKKRTLYDGFQIGIMQRTTLNIGRNYLEQLIELTKLISHPKSSRLLEYEGWMKDISSHRNYLIK